MLDSCVLWNAQVVVRPPGRERIIQELCEIHIHTALKPCVVGEPGCKPGSQRTNLYQVSVKSSPRISPMPRPSCICERRSSVLIDLSHGAG